MTNSIQLKQWPLRRKIALGAVAIMVLLGPAVWLLTRSPKQSEAAWFDENWGYRKTVQVTNNTSEESNVYIGISVETSDTSRFQTDCGDLRFTKYDGELLPYYIASGCGATASVHINFNLFPAGNQTIYYYYGNPSADNGFEAEDFANQASNYTIDSYGSEENSPGPLLYWKFDEGTGSTAFNSGSLGSSGHAQFASGDSSPSWRNADLCLSGNCLLFDDSNDYLSVGATASVKTIAFWVRTGSTATAFIGFNSTAAVVVSSGTVTTNGITDPTIYINGAAASALSANAWQHIEITTATAVNANAITIGRSGSSYLTGFLDEVKLYTYTRSDSEVKMDHNSTVTGKGAAATFGSAGSSTGSVSDGLIGYWKMDEGSSVSVYDFSGNNNTASFASGDSAPGWTSGMYGTGLSFGSNDYLSVGSTINSIQTISLWIKPGSTAVSFLDLNGSAYLTVSAGTVTAAGISSPSFYLNGASSTAITTGRWQLLVVTTASPVTGSNINLGKANDGFLDGAADDLRFYNRALSPAEVTTLYNWAPGPLGYWKLDEGSGNYAYDSSGNEFTSTLYGLNRTKGKYGNALRSFDNNATIEYAATADHDELDFTSTQDYTLNAWAKFGATENDYYLILRKLSNSTPYHGYYMIGYSTKISCIQRYDATLDEASYSFTTANSGWQHVSCVMDRNGTATGTAGLHIFINGILRGSDTSLNAAAYNHDGPVNFGESSDTFEGDTTMDDIKIYNYARTPAQIIADMNGGHPLGGSPVGSALAHWKFDEGAKEYAYNYGFGGIGYSAAMASGNSAPTWSMNGKFSKALQFDGSNDYLSVSSTISNIQAVTFWANPGSTATAFIGLNSTAAIALVNGALTANGFSAPAYYVNGRLSSTLSANQWQHVAIVTNGTVNGNAILIGKSGTSYYNGQLDELKIYNAPLTAEEVKIDLNRGSAAVLGSLSVDTGNTSPATAASQTYCIPGNTTACSPPVAEWKLDENTFTEAHDTSGNNYTGTIYDADWIPGVRGSALHFINGSDSRVQLGDIPSLDNASQVTITAWAKRAASGAVVYIGKQVINHDLIIELYGDGYAYFNVSNGTFAGAAAASNDLYWHHYALVFDGDQTGNENRLKTYIDGRPTTNTIYGGTVPATTTGNTAPMYLGHNSYDDTHYSNGYIDEVRFYDYARTPAQIAWEYNRGGPIGWWKMDECQGNIAYDMSGVGNTGMITIGASGSNISVGTCSSAAANTAWYNGASGKYSASLNFDGSDDFISIGATVSSSRAVSLWVKPASTSQKILQLSASDSIEISSGTVAVTGFGTETVYIDGRPSTSFPDTNWHHLTVVSGSDITANTIYLGRVSTDYYSGQLDDIRFYSYPLSATQIKEIHNEASSVKFGS